MSRIGKKPVSIPKGTKASVDGDTLTIEGPKGKLRQALLPEIAIKIEQNEISFTRSGESGPERARHGLMRALVANAIEGVSQGFSKQLEVIGVGYRAEVKGREVHFALGYSHPVIFPIPEGVNVEVDKQNRITVSGCDRQQIGQVAAEIRSLRKPDPYKGKGIKYATEVIRRKVGKAGSK